MLDKVAFTFESGHSNKSYSKYFSVYYVAQDGSHVSVCAGP